MQPQHSDAPPSREQELARLERHRQALLAEAQAKGSELERLEATRRQIEAVEARGSSATALPPDPLDRERFFAVHKHLGMSIQGFVHTLASLDFGEEAVLLNPQSAGPSGQPNGANHLDVALRSMRNQLEPTAREVRELPQVVRGPLDDALETIFAILTPRPDHIARLVGPARLHLDLRFAHVNMARLSAVAERLNMDLIAGLQKETLLREQGQGQGAGSLLDLSGVGAAS